MASKAVLVLCVQTLLTQSVLSLCIGSIEPTCGPAPLGCGCAPFAPSSGGGSFVVTSSSPIAPTGISIVSDNLYEGTLCVGGNLPWLGSVGVEGEFPTAGAGAVSYGCGDGEAAVVAEEGPVVTGIVAPAYPSYAIAPGYGSIINAYGVGCGGYGYRGFNYGSGVYGTRYGGCGCGY